MTDPWDERYTYLHEYHKHQPFMYLGKYTSPIDPVGKIPHKIQSFLCVLFVFFVLIFGEI